MGGLITFLFESFSNSKFTQWQVLYKRYRKNRTCRINNSFAGSYCISTGNVVRQMKSCRIFSGLKTGAGG